METNISAITEASDKYFHRTRVAVHSFIKHNQWFDGTLYLLTISSLPISQKNIDALCQIYQNIQIVNLSSLTEVSTIETKFKQKNRDTEHLCKYLKLFITQLNIPNLLYFSNSSLFLGSVSEIILNNNSYVTNTDFSIFYVNSLDITLDSEIQEKIIKSEPIEKLFDSVLKYNFSTINTDSYDCATSFSDNIFNKKKSQLSRLKYINYNTFYSKFANCSKINQIWLQVNHEIQKILNKPSSIKKEVKITRPISKKAAISPNSLINQTDLLKSKKIAICTICNDEFSIGTQTMIYSFLKNNKWFTQDIIIFYNSEYSNLSNENINTLSKLYNNIIFYKIESDDYLPLINKFNSSRNSKRFIPSLFTFEAFELAKKYDKILYLDSDMLVLQDIFELFKLNDEIVVTPDTGKYDLSKKYKTFNGGFLLIDGLSATREYKKKILLFSMGCKNMALADQSIMNDFFKNRVIYLDSRYNCLKRCFPDDSFRFFDTRIKIIHYVGEKPWANNKKDFEKKYSKIEYLWHSEYLELSNNLNNEYFNTNIIL
jgi:lipopolysaccharide biosynthesis glycosyltransferase